MTTSLCLALDYDAANGEGDLAKRTHTPSTPVSTARRASSMLQRTCVRILALRPSLQMASQSFLDCSDAAGDVSSM